MEYRDRREAGKLLAGEVARLALDDPMVLALPRGGVPVAAEVARRIGAPLDVLLVRKLGVPIAPEHAMGAIAEDGTAVVDTALVQRLGISGRELREVVTREVDELRRRSERYRDARPPADVAGRTVVVVDDGLATGLTDLAAVRALRRRGAATIVVAAPVASREALATIGAEADEVVSPLVPRELMGVGRWYEDFSQVTDDEVVAALAGAGAPAARRAAEG